MPVCTECGGMMIEYDQAAGNSFYGKMRDCSGGKHDCVRGCVRGDIEWSGHGLGVVCRSGRK
ncbi:hypothetical protein BDQ12DRAFT_305417 [Crucibulum laeve]|uniref:Uncharacterized protein n=1 Tax=Crucibulum laeve TaxID=68775 RepID=A0A5C3LUP9_9AGAR|nr:hypothetical protein BDQ12DRAFT_305417 [Crucibulum laeve]